MTNINYSYIEDYIRSVFKDHPPEIKAIEDYASDKHVPIMERESLELLKTVIKLAKPRRILELGTAIGYSAIIMALQNESIQVTSIDRNEERLKDAQANIRALGLEGRISLIYGDISQVLDDLDPGYDFVLFDAGKSHYMEYFDKCLDLIDDGAVIFSDNVLFKGLIANDDLVNKRNRTITRNMRDYLDFICRAEGIQSSLIPIGDGVAISLIEEKNKWKK